MVSAVVRDLWAEPAPEPSRSSKVDKILIPLLVAIGIIDGVLSAEVGWPVVTIPLMSALPLALIWRHTRPLPVAMAVFGSYAALHGAMLIAGVSSTFLNGGLIAVTVYTLARWASGRDAIIGLGFAAVGTALAGSTGVLREFSGVVGLPGFVTIWMLLGVALRLWSTREAARLSEARMSERNRIARELHDTIAHHVSAIAIQAQGGQEIVLTDPQAAQSALGVIEKEASSTLAEMRLILGVLRTEAPAELRPSRVIADIAGLADDSIGPPRVEVLMSGDLENVSPSVAAALFRLAQEAVTNSRRHARHATKVEVEILGTDSQIAMTVTDDGQPVAQNRSGYGLLGMVERATLLGGDCSAGPANTDKGWVVTATMPRNGRAL